VGVNTPATVGVPLMMPVEVPSASPAGSAPRVILQAIGFAPEAVKTCEYAAPISAEGKRGLTVIVGAAGGAVTVSSICFELLPEAFVA